MEFHERCYEFYDSGGHSSAILWDITPCSPLKVNRRSEEHIAPIFGVEE
jgi:hypothetical protein